MRKLLCIVSLFVLVAAPAWAQGHGEGGEEFDPIHHVADGYYLDFTPLGKFELPRLFVVRTEAGGLRLDAFGSTAGALHSGRYRVEDAGGAGHDAGVKTPAEPYEVGKGDVGTGNPIEHVEPMVAGATHLESSIVPVDGRIVLDLSITRHLAFALLAMLIVASIFISLGRRYARGIGRDTPPRGFFQVVFETLVVFVRDEIARPTIGEKYRRYLPYLLTAFFFIWTCNLIGLVPFGATATANLMVTATLAVFTFIVTQFSGSKDYWKHIFWPPGVPAFVKPILIPVEILGMFTKPFALAIRLFANMNAGHLIILSLIGLIFSFSKTFGAAGGYGVSPVSVGFSLFIYLLELMVATIQAYIFTMLSALFIGMATAEHHHAPEEGHLPQGAGH